MTFKNSTASPHILSRKLPLLVILIILWLATGLRFYQIDRQSFWNDEGNSARLSERSLALIIEGTASDIHPPLYYIVLRGWRELLGEHEFGLRSFSAFAGILTVASILSLARLYLPVSRLIRWGWLIIILAAFLAAINPALIYYSRETRMYALLGLLSALSTIVVWRWLNADRRFSWGVLYIILAAAGLYTHYFFPATLILQNLIVLIWVIDYLRYVLFSPQEIKKSFSIRKTILQWVGMMLAVLLIYLPWLPVFFRQTGGRVGIGESFAAFFLRSGQWLAFGETMGSNLVVLVTAAVFLLGIWAIITGRKRSLIPFLGTTIPVVFMFASGATMPAFFKFLLTGSPFFCLLLAEGLDIRTGGGRRKIWAVVPALLLFLVLIGTTFSLNNLYNNPVYFRADYRGMAARIVDENHPNAGIILNAPNQWEVFTYYYQGEAPVYPLPKGQPDPSILEPQLEEITSNHDRIYALFWGEDQRDPNHIIESWLDMNGFKAYEEWVGDVRFVIYAIPGEGSREMENTAEVSFGHIISLEGFTIKNDSLQAGDIAQITLFWQAKNQIEEQYKVFIHLIDSQGNLAAQRDSEPGGGRAITSSWQPGETVIDNHGLLLPVDLPPGDYQIIVGLYDIFDPTDRLIVVSPDNGLDYWSLTSIKIE